jgi:hypothetical protein
MFAEGGLWSSELEEVMLLSSPDMNCRHLMPRFHAAEVFVYICNQSKVYIEVLFFSFFIKKELSLYKYFKS